MGTLVSTLAMIAAGGLGLVFVPAGAGAASTGAPWAAAGAARWSVVPSTDVKAPEGHFNGVSCVGAAACTAVGYRIKAGAQVPLAEHWNGREWAIQPTPGTGPLSSVSCTSARACTAVGGGLAERWDGARWVIEPVPGDGSLSSVSCASARSCTAAGTLLGNSGSTTPFAASWDGGSWSVQTVPAPAGSDRSGLSGVSCLPGGTCTAVGFAFFPRGGDEGDEQEMLAESWNGTSWVIQPTPSPLDNPALAGVSCTSPRACTAVGNTIDDAPLALAWDGSHWTVQAGQPDEGTLSGVSCSSATACTAVGQVPAVVSTSPITTRQVAFAERWNGARWAAQHAVSAGVASGLAAVSCPSTGSCTAAGSAGGVRGGEEALAERWRGTWAIQPTGNPPATQPNALPGVSCTSARRCTAVGGTTSHGNPAGPFGIPVAERWDGHRWAGQKPPPFPLAPLSGLTAVSCTSATACTAVGHKQDPTINHAFAEHWNGHTWAGQRLPNPTKGPLGGIFRDLVALSCTSARACTAVGHYVPTVEPDSPASTLAERWNGRTWAIQPTPVLAKTGAGTQLTGVSCTSRSSCTAVGQGPGGKPLAERWNGRSWTVQAMPGRPGAGPLAAVVCTSGNACTAVGGSLAERWDGHTWAIQAPPFPAGAHRIFLNAVDCNSSHACTAAGYYTGGRAGRHTLAEAWNGTQWAIQHTPDRGPLMGVSCTPDGSCVAVGQTRSARTLIERRS